MADSSSTEVKTRSHMTRYLLYYVDDWSLRQQLCRRSGAPCALTSVLLLEQQRGSKLHSTNQRMVVIEAGLDLMMHVYRAP